MLIPKQETFYVLSYTQLDSLIQQHFHKPDFHCVADYEWRNMEEHSGVVSIHDLENEMLMDSDELQEFLDHPGVPSYPAHWSVLLAELARRGEVPEGRYLIEVCW